MANEETTDKAVSPKRAPKTFLQTLQDHHYGYTAEEATLKMAEAIAASERTGKATELVIKMKIKPASKAQGRQNAADLQFSNFGDDPDAPKFIVIVLTTMHLDHDPTNCDPDNLRPACQRHHLLYDQQHHKESAYATRMAKRNNLELPL